MMKSLRNDIVWTGAGPILLMAILLQTACTLDQQILYHGVGLQVGLQHDPTTNVVGVGEMGTGSAPPRNDHPHDCDVSQLRPLLGSLVVTAPDDAQRSKQLDAPLFSPDELNKLVPLLVPAFRRATSTDRLFFSLNSTPFSPGQGKTTGTIFVRHHHMHVALNPFVLPVDGEPSQMAGLMTIKALEPAQEVFDKGSGDRLWSKSETMHISLKIPDELPRELGDAQSGKESTNIDTDRENGYKTLQRQVEDLTTTLKDVHAKMAGHAGELESVKAEVKRLQDQIANKVRAQEPTKSPLKQ